MKTVWGGWWVEGSKGWFFLKFPNEVPLKYPFKISLMLVFGLWIAVLLGLEFRFVDSDLEKACFIVKEAV